MTKDVIICKTKELKTRMKQQYTCRPSHNVHHKLNDSRKYVPFYSSCSKYILKFPLRSLNSPYVPFTLANQLKRIISGKDILEKRLDELRNRLIALKNRQHSESYY